MLCVIKLANKIQQSIISFFSNMVYFDWLFWKYPSSLLKWITTDLLQESRLFYSQLDFTLVSALKLPKFCNVQSYSFTLNHAALLIHLTVKLASLACLCMALVVAASR